MAFDIIIPVSLLSCTFSTHDLKLHVVDSIADTNTGENVWFIMPSKTRLNQCVLHNYGALLHIKLCMQLLKKGGGKLDLLHARDLLVCSKRFCTAV